MSGLAYQNISIIIAVSGGSSQRGSFGSIQGSFSERSGGSLSVSALIQSVRAGKRGIKPLEDHLGSRGWFSRGSQPRCATRTCRAWNEPSPIYSRTFFLFFIKTALSPSLSPPLPHLNAAITLADPRPHPSTLLPHPPLATIMSAPLPPSPETLTDTPSPL